LSLRWIRLVVTPRLANSRASKVSGPTAINRAKTPSLKPRNRSGLGKGKRGPRTNCAACGTAPCARGIFGAAFGASPGAGMCPASVAAIFTPRARMVFADEASNATGSREMPNGQIKAACSKARCCALVLPIPSHDCCAKLLLALFRVLRPRDRDGLRRRSRRLVDAAPGHQGPNDARVRGSLEPVALTARCWPARPAPASAACASASPPARCPAGPRQGGGVS